MCSNACSCMLAFGMVKRQQTLFNWSITSTVQNTKKDQPENETEGVESHNTFSWNNFGAISVILKCSCCNKMFSVLFEHEVIEVCNTVQHWGTSLSEQRRALPGYACLQLAEVRSGSCWPWLTLSCIVFTQTGAQTGNATNGIDKSAIQRIPVTFFVL